MDSLFDQPEHHQTVSSSSKGFSFYRKNPGADQLSQRVKLTDNQTRLQKNSNNQFYSQFTSFDEGFNNYQIEEPMSQLNPTFYDSNINSNTTPIKVQQGKQNANISKWHSVQNQSQHTISQTIQSNISYSLYDSGSEDEGSSLRSHSNSLSGSFQKLQISSPTPSIAKNSGDHDLLSQINIPIPLKHKPSINLPQYQLFDSCTEDQPQERILQNQERIEPQLLLGELCPLKALKKQFPIIFPVGIPVLGELSRFLNLGQPDEEQPNTINDQLLMGDNLEELDWDQDKLCNLQGTFNPTERRLKVEKYLEKKKTRKWKTIRYGVRKNLADQRERISGRFVKQKNSRFNQENLDATYLLHLTRESDRMQLIEFNNPVDNSFEILNNSFES